VRVPEGYSPLHVGPLTGTWYRAVRTAYLSTLLQTSYSRQMRSRFSPATAEQPGFEVLYLAEDPQVTLFEARSLLGSPALFAPNPNLSVAVVPLQVRLHRVVDLTDPNEQELLATNAQELTGDWEGYHQRGPEGSVRWPVGRAPTHELGLALFAIPMLEGVVTYSARVSYTRTLVVFPTKLGPSSFIRFSDVLTGEVHGIP
jgi:hypothetical protein